MTGPSQEELTAAIDLAWAAVQASDAPEELRSAAFSEVLRSVLTPATAPSSAAPRTDRTQSGIQGENVSESGDADSTAPTLAEDEVLRRVSEETGVSIDDLERLVVIDDGTVKLLGAHTKFGSSNAEKARAVAQMVTVVRKVGMGAADTSYDIIKAACESKHCYDSKNFATEHLPKITGFVVKGEKSSRRLEAKNAGVAAFPALVEKVLAA